MEILDDLEYRHRDWVDDSASLRRDESDSLHKYYRIYSNWGKVSPGSSSLSVQWIVTAFIENVKTILINIWAACYQVQNSHHLLKVASSRANPSKCAGYTNRLVIPQDQLKVDESRTRVSGQGIDRPPHV